MLTATPNKKEFYYRLIITSTVLVIIGLLVSFAYYPWVNLLLLLTVALLTALGVWEYAQMAQCKGSRPSAGLMIGVAISVIAALYASFNDLPGSQLTLLLLVLGFASLFINRFRNPKNALLNIAVEFFGICYLVIPFGFMLIILYPHSPTEDGRWWLLYLIVVTKAADIGGYLVGKCIGKHRLAPYVSPSKTVEGAIGGFVLALFISFLFSNMTILKGLSIGKGLWLGSLIAILSQLGDLAESVFKRDAAIKDSNEIPGIGGILDMMDSIFFTAPAVYFFIRSIQ